MANRPGEGAAPTLPQALQQALAGGTIALYAELGLEDALPAFDLHCPLMRLPLAGSADIRDGAADLHDFPDTAALVRLLDLVVTVDIGVAHVAGALALARHSFADV